MAWYDEILGDQEGDYDVGTSANYGTPTNVSPDMLSNLFDSFNGLDLSGINLSNIFGDQPGDFPTTGSELKNWDAILGNDQALKELFGG